MEKDSTAPGILISLVIPAYNEENRLPRTLEILLGQLEQKEYEAEIIIVDDGSTDNTKGLTKAYGKKVRVLHNTINQGKGYSVRRGMLEAKGQYIIFMDADLSVPPKYIDDMLSILRNSADVVIGTRRAEGASIEVHQPFLREKLGQLFNMVIRILGLSKFHDTQCGFKGFTRQAAQEIFSKQKTAGFAFDVEILTIATQSQFNIVELPVLWYNSAETKVVPLRDPALMLFDIIRIRLYLWLKQYSREKK